MQIINAKKFKLLNNQNSMEKNTLAKIVTAATGLAATLITLEFGIKAYEKYKPKEKKEEAYFYYLDPNIDYNITTNNNDPRLLNSLKYFEEITEKEKSKQTN